MSYVATTAPNATFRHGIGFSVSVRSHRQVPARPSPAITSNEPLLPRRASGSPFFGSFSVTVNTPLVAVGTIDRRADFLSSISAGVDVQAADLVFLKSIFA